MSRSEKKSSIARQREGEYNNGECKENYGACKQPQALAGAFVLGFLTAWLNFFEKLGYLVHVRVFSGLE